jgi:hypothetical protein
VITKEFAGAVLGTDKVNIADDNVPAEIVTAFPEEKVAVGMLDATGVTVAFRLTIAPNDPRLVT